MAVSECKIKIQNVSKTFVTSDEKQVPVLGGISLTVQKNEFLVILGAAQCGKTVLLNILAGLEEATDGRVEYPEGENPHHGDIGFVFQRYALFPWKTVIQNVEMNPKLRGVPKEQRRETARQYIKMVGLEKFENAYPNQLSGGMKQRVGIARAYASESDILLMDEPFGALDAQTRYQMEEEILKIWEQKKKTLIFVTNNIEEALYLGDRIILLAGEPTGVRAEYIPDLPRPRNLTDSAFLKWRNEIASNMDLVL